MRKIFLIILIANVIVWANFTRSSAGIVSDDSTGFMWQDFYPSKIIESSTWEGGIDYCENLILGGYSDWRLPNKNELISITGFDMYKPAINNIFLTIYSARYWTSTTYAEDNKLSWDISFHTAEVRATSSKSTIFFIRCVRGYTYLIK